MKTIGLIEGFRNSRLELLKNLSNLGQVIFLDAKLKDRDKDILIVEYQYKIPLGGIGRATAVFDREN